MAVAAGGVMFLSACGGSGEVAPVLANENEVYSISARIEKNRPKNPQTDASIKQSYENVYFFPGELYLSPKTLTTKANTWMNEASTRSGQGMGCKIGADVNKPYVATWFYPCGSVLKLKNIDKDSKGFGREMLVVVADAGPNRKLSGEGWKNNRVRQYALDISPMAAAKLAHTTGEGGALEVTLVKLPAGYESSPMSLDLLNTPPSYDNALTYLRPAIAFDLISATDKIKGEVKEVIKAAPVVNPAQKPVEIAPSTGGKPCWSSWSKKNYYYPYDNKKERLKCDVEGKWIRY